MLDPGGAWRLVQELAAEAVVIHAPEPWTYLAEVGDSAVAIPALGVQKEMLDRLVAEAPERRWVIGIGGGTALDAAKYLALKRGLALVLVPSILSVDAGFTREAGVRRNGRVEYIGPIEPARIVVDPDLIRTAPPALNRAGVGDLLSCHTALWDWELAERHHHPAGPAVPWDATVADVGWRTLARLRAEAHEIGDVSDRGIALLAEGFAEIGAQCTAAGHARFEEGSEHFFAYALEAATGKTYIHGELIAFATLALAILQGNEPESVAAIIAQSRVRASPQDFDLDESLFVQVMTELPGYVRENNLWWSCIDRETMTPNRARDVWIETQRLLKSPSGAHAA